MILAHMFKYKGIVVVDANLTTAKKKVSIRFGAGSWKLAEYTPLVGLGENK